MKKKLKYEKKILNPQQTLENEFLKDKRLSTVIIAAILIT